MVNAKKYEVKVTVILTVEAKSGEDAQRKGVEAVGERLSNHQTRRFQRGISTEYVYGVRGKLIHD